MTLTHEFGLRHDLDVLNAWTLSDAPTPRPEPKKDPHAGRKKKHYVGRYVRRKERRYKPDPPPYQPHVVSFMRQVKTATVAEYRKRFGLTENVAHKRLKLLWERGVLEYADERRPKRKDKVYKLSRDIEAKKLTPPPLTPTRPRGKL